MTLLLADPVAATPWVAQLDLAFIRDPNQHARTTLMTKHVGPLRIQKALYPEGGMPCHAIVIHPPGGIAGGDMLGIDITVEADAAALITTPGAAKWYGSTGQPASQRVVMHLEGALEWLPQETIIFDHAQPRSALEIHAAADARMIGWECLIFGRKGCGERFTSGLFSQHIHLHIEGEPIWEDRLVLHGDDPLFSSPVGLRGHHALATCWALLPKSQRWDDVTLEALREHSPTIAWTRLHTRLLVGRMLGEPMLLQAALRHAWHGLRPSVLGRAANPPRIWAT